MGICAIIGTDKGAFLLRADDGRADWRLSGPFFKGWKVTASARDDKGRTYAATTSQVYGPAIHVSDDLEHWRQLEHGPSWPEETERTFRQVWTLVSSGDRLYAGIDDAGLFVSDDRGETWQSVEGLNEHHTRPAWFPGAAGLCLHAVVVDSKDPRRLWAGISSVGVFRSDDGGLTWNEKNGDIPPMIEDKDHKQIGRCVHALVPDPDDPNLIFRREHNGMFRTRDGGDTWERIEQGLGSWFGFPLAMDRRTRTLYDVPLESDEYRVPIDGAFTVYRSRDGGDSWEPLRKGLPQENAYMGVLRSALDVDHRDPCGIYLGTTAGTIYLSADGGDAWTRFPATLPRILSVEVHEE